MQVGTVDEAKGDKVLLRWANHTLRERGRAVKNLDEDFSDGVNLCHLVEIITSKPLGFNKQPNNTIKRTENISLAVERVSHELGFKLYGLSVQDIEAGSKKAIGGLLYQIISKAYISRAVNAIDNATRRTGGSVTNSTSKQKLLSFLQQIVASHISHEVSNLDSSLHDGAALVALVNCFFPGALGDAMDLRPLDRLNAVLQDAANHGVPALLDAEDIYSLKKSDDALSMLYLSLLIDWVLKSPIADTVVTESREKHVAGVAAKPAPAEGPPAAIMRPFPQLRPVPVQQAEAAVQQPTQLNPIKAQNSVETAATEPQTAKHEEATPQAVQMNSAPQAAAPKAASVPVENKPQVVAVQVENVQTPQSATTPQDLPPAASKFIGEQLSEALKSVPVEVAERLSGFRGRVSDDELLALCNVLNTKFVALQFAIEDATRTQQVLEQRAARHAKVAAASQETNAAHAEERSRLSARIEQLEADLEAATKRNENAPPRLVLPPPPALPVGITISASPSAAAPPAAAEPQGETEPGSYLLAPDASQDIAESPSLDTPAEAALLHRVIAQNIHRYSRYEPIVLIEDTVMSEDSDAVSDAPDDGDDDGGDLDDVDVVPLRLARSDPSFPRPLTLLDSPAVQLPRDLTVSNTVAPTRSFRVEDGAELPWWLATDPAQQERGIKAFQASNLEDPEHDSAWFKRFFLNYDPVLFVGEHKEHGPFALAVIKEEVHEAPHDALCMTTHYSQYRAMLFIESGIQRVSIPLIDERSSITVMQLITFLCPALGRGSLALRTVKPNEHQNQFVVLEEILSAHTFKFGVLPVLPNQEAEEDMFANNGSPAFDEFLSLLGAKIELQGWDRFRGGLDTKNGGTGTHSVFTEYRGYEVMFHVSTLLPYSATDKQQLARKRHIGNDICTVIFVDEEASSTTPSFSPAAISSHFLHVFAVVRPFRDQHGTLLYTVNIACKDEVPEFGPLLRNPPVFRPHELRDFLLAKLINGETATYAAPSFKDKLMRTFKGQLQQLCSKTDTQKSARKQDPLYALVDQRSQRPPLQVLTHQSARTNKIAWAATVVSSGIRAPVLCGVAYSGGHLVGTSAGLYFFSGSAMRLMPTRAHNYSQMAVLEGAGVAVALCSRPNSVPGLVVIKLSGVDALLQSQSIAIELLPLAAKSNATCFAVDPRANSSAEPTLLVAAKKRLFVFRFSRASQSFVSEKAITLAVSPKMVSLRGQTALIGGGSRLYFVDIASGTQRKVELGVTVDEPQSVVQLDKEMLLAFSNKCVFMDEAGQLSRHYTIHWSTFPHTVAYAYPYVVGFMRDMVEVRTLLNGRLVQALPLQSSVVLGSTALPLVAPIYVAANPDNFADHSAQVHKLAIQ